MSRSKPILLLLLFFVLAWIGWAGLRPFDFQRPNRVAWIDGGPGLRFEGGGMAVTRDEVAWDTSSGPARLELELDLRPGPAPTDTSDHDIFVLFDEVPVPALVVYQTGTDLVVADRVKNPAGDRWYNDFRVPGALVAGERRHVRVVDGKPPTLFIDGQAVEPSSGYAIPIGRSGEPLHGRVLLGTHPDGRTPWNGELLGLTLKDGSTTLVRYGFERSRESDGTRVPNEAGVGLELELPPYFRSLRPVLGRAAGDALDLARNLLGFVPFGYVLALLLREREPVRVLLLVSAAGLALSLAIELAQTLTVTRVSSAVDLALNTLGALAGAWLARRLGQNASQAR